MADMARRIKVVVWSELTESPEVYPSGIHGTLAAALSPFEDMEVSRSSIAGAACGLSKDRLDGCDVLVYWSHIRHGDVPAKAIEGVVKAVTERGMGFLPLHSSLDCGILRSLFRTTCRIASWREENEAEYVKVTAPDHPIAQGIADFTIPQEEMYGEPWDVPAPEAVVLTSRFGKGGEFRSGCCWERGAGRVFYFRPGHETNRSFYQTEVIGVIANGVRWCAKR